MSKTTMRQRSINPGWYQVGQALTSAGAGSAQTFDMSALAKIVSDAKMLGFTPYAHAISVVVNYNGNYGVAPAVATLSDINRGCFFDVNILQSNVKNAWFNTRVTLAHHRIAGRIINARDVALDRNIPYKRRLFQRMDTSDLTTQALIPSPDVDKRPDLCSGFGDDENFQAVQVVIPAAFDFSDVFTLPVCKQTIGGFSQDRLPLEMFSDPKNPVKYTITEQIVTGNDIRTDVFNAPGMNISYELWIYVSFVGANSALPIGVQWTCNSYSFNNNGPAPSHYHVFLGFFPRFDAPTKDGGVAVPYEPQNYIGNLAGSQLRVYDCNVQVFPLNTESDFTRMYELWNVGGALGEHPTLNYDQRLADTRYKGPGSLLAGAVVNPNYSVNARGYMTGFTVFPLLTNTWLARGFMPNIMVKPGCAADLRIALEGAAPVPTTAAFNIYVSEYDDDRITAASYALYGKQDGKVDPSSWQPQLANDMSAFADSCKDIVPWVLNR